MTPQFDKRGQFINPADYDSPNHTLYHNNTLTTEKETKIVRYHIAGASPNYTYTLSNITIQGIGALTISFLKLGKTAGTLYLGTSDGDVYKVTGINPAGDQVVTNINKLGDSQAREDQTLATTKIMDKATTSTGNVSSIDFGTDENTLIVTKSNYNIKSVFYTTDAGTAWVSKDDALHGLPNIPIRYALINPKSPKQVLLATELGVWSTIDITATNPKWEPNNTTLANVRCDMLKYRASDETVVVATHGRGVFSTKINQPDCITPVADNQTICDATTASLTANCATGTTATWYDAAGTTKAGSGSPFITPSLTAKTSYKVRCETPDCKSAFVDVTITVNPAIEAPIAHETIIKPDVEMPLKATCTTGTPVWYETATSVTPLGTGSFTTPKLEKSVSYYVACESGGKPNCASSRTHQFVKMHLFGAESVELPGNISSVEKGSIQNQAAFRVKSELGDAEIAVDVYPNPTTGLCYWILESKDATDVNLSLFNTQGQEELNQTLPTPSQIHEGTIDLRKLETGSYFLKFKVGDKSVVRKIIKN